MAEREEPAAVEEKEKDGKLPPEFWEKLLGLPQCKIDGSCDGCGRCEH